MNSGQNIGEESAKAEKNTKAPKQTEGGLTKCTATENDMFVHPDKSQLQYNTETQPQSSGNGWCFGRPQKLDTELTTSSGDSGHYRLMEAERNTFKPPQKSPHCEEYFAAQRLLKLNNENYTLVHRISTLENENSSLALRIPALEEDNNSLLIRISDLMTQLDIQANFIAKITEANDKLKKELEGKMDRDQVIQELVKHIEVLSIDFKKPFEKN